MNNVDFSSFNTTYPYWFLFEYARVFLRLSLPWLCTQVWGGDFKIRARSYWGMGVFVLMLSNMNIVWQKLLCSCGIYSSLKKVYGRPTLAIRI